jgi:hypothetical protein
MARMSAAVEKEAEPTELTSSARLEYETTVAQYQNCTTLRRQDMVFVTAIQGAVVSIVGNELLSLDLGRFVLSGIAFVVVLLGLNSERRLSAYMTGYSARALEIERAFGLRALRAGVTEVKKTRWLASNSAAFPAFYLANGLGWITIWIANLLT